ncbi:MAG: hypothetical protein GXP15_00020 [Gammaproteobacteria bacterium]|nr:hypothetical protein [Gammaproteobacteria bacterium]
MATTEKSAFDKIQSALVVLTPILVVVFGAYLNQNITKVESQIKNVEAMKPYFDMMAGEDPAKAKMAAYALYMLNKEDPSMAVSMIMAPQNPELMGVLIDLGSREPKIWNEVKKILDTADETRGVTKMQEAAQEIIGGIGTTATTATTREIQGWSYLGDFTPPVKDSRIKLDKGEIVPVQGQSYELKQAVNVRADKPRSPDYSLARITGVAAAGSTVVIDELDIDKNDRVWAKVSVAHH